ncbi:MAG TPA: HAD-IIA family hydrolase [Propionibacteriaceae bacterium]|nr:HAD-IIA family hydrolase [Propionibacteriaceae bacterium]
MTAPTAVIDGYDAALFDLDGVVYLGPVAVPGAAEGIAALRERGTRIGFVTNNAARPPAAVAAHLVELGISATSADVVTSAQAGAHLVLNRFGPGARVLAVGGEGVAAALAELGLVAVRSADDHPVAVLQGYGFDLTWQQLNEAAVAIHRGAHWVATNTDPTRPTDRGLVPGNGAAVAAVAMAVTDTPEVAGKPYRPLLDDTVARLGAQRPVFVGDRLDTDIAGAQNSGLDSMLVLSGSHRAADLLAAAPAERPTYLGLDLRALLQPPLVVTVDQGVWRCGTASVSVADGTLRVAGAQPDTPAAIWAAAHAAWWLTDQGRPVDPVVRPATPR